MILKVSIFVIGVFFGVALSVPIECNIEKCAKPLKLYEELGCKAVYGSNSCCAKRFECPDFNALDDNKCSFGGREYKIGEILPRNFTDKTKCAETCFCTREDSSPAKFTCTNSDCGVASFKVPGCINIYGDLNECCSTSIVCDEEEKKSLASCFIGGQEYREGEKFIPDSNPCYECLCNKDFDNTTITDNPHCRKFNCHIDLRYKSFVQRGCLPVFRNGKCCPVDWECPKYGRKVVKRAAADDETQTPRDVFIVTPSKNLEQYLAEVRLSNRGNSDEKSSAEIVYESTTVPTILETTTVPTFTPPTTTPTISTTPLPSTTTTEQIHVPTPSSDPFIPPTVKLIAPFVNDNEDEKITTSLPKSSSESEEASTSSESTTTTTEASTTEASTTEASTTEASTTTSTTTSTTEAATTTTEVSATEAEIILHDEILTSMKVTTLAAENESTTTKTQETPTTTESPAEEPKEVDETMKNLFGEEVVEEAETLIPSTTETISTTTEASSSTESSTVFVKSSSESLVSSETSTTSDSQTSTVASETTEAPKVTQAVREIARFLEIPEELTTEAVTTTVAEEESTATVSTSQTTEETSTTTTSPSTTEAIEESSTTFKPLPESVLSVSFEIPPPVPNEETTATSTETTTTTKADDPEIPEPTSVFPTAFENLLTTLKEFVAKAEALTSTQSPKTAEVVVVNAATTTTESSSTDSSSQMEQQVQFVNYTVSLDAVEKKEDHEHSEVVQPRKLIDEPSVIVKRSVPEDVDLIPRYYKQHYSQIKTKGCVFNGKAYKIGEVIATNNDCLKCICEYAPIGHCVLKEKCNL